jgi:hypothetical protein
MLNSFVAVRVLAVLGDLEVENVGIEFVVSLVAVTPALQGSY